MLESRIDIAFLNHMEDPLQRAYRAPRDGIPAAYSIQPRTAHSSSPESEGEKQCWLASNERMGGGGEVRLLCLELREKVCQWRLSKSSVSLQMCLGHLLVMVRYTVNIGLKLPSADAVEVSS